MSERFDFGLFLQMILLLERRAFLDTGAGFNCRLRCWVEIDVSTLTNLIWIQILETISARLELIPAILCSQSIHFFGFVFFESVRILLISNTLYSWFLVWDSLAYLGGWCKQSFLACIHVVALLQTSELFMICCSIACWGICYASSFSILHVEMRGSGHGLSILALASSGPVRGDI